jgi:hypothetical protein
MANILAVVELQDIGIIFFYPSGNVLAVTEENDVPAFYTAAQMAVTEAEDTASFDVNVQSQAIELEVTEAQDVPAMDVQQGTVFILSPTELNDTVAFHIYESVLIEIQANEFQDTGYVDILQGFLAEVAGVDAEDAGIIVFSADTLAELAASEDTDYATIFIQEIPVTFIREAIIMHLFNFAVSEYKNYNFNCLLHFDKMFLGLNEEGIFLLDGDTDLGESIQAEIKTGTIDLAAKGAISIPREAWLAYRSNNGMELDAKLDEVADLPPMFFQKVVEKIRECREKFGRGIKNRFITLDVKNVDGASFDFESLRIMGDVIKRKTR